MSRIAGTKMSECRSGASATGYEDVGVQVEGTSSAGPTLESAVRVVSASYWGAGRKAQKSIAILDSKSR